MIEYLILIGLTVFATLYVTNTKVRHIVNDAVKSIKTALKGSDDDSPPGPPTGAVPV